MHIQKLTLKIMTENNFNQINLIKPENADGQTK